MIYSFSSPLWPDLGSVNPTFSPCFTNTKPGLRAGAHICSQVTLGVELFFSFFPLKVIVLLASGHYSDPNKKACGINHGGPVQ